MNKKQLFYFMPFLVCLLLSFFFLKGLSLDPKALPSVLLNKKAPLFSLPELYSPQKSLNNNDFKGKVWLLNVWGSWCESCINEHAFLFEVANTIPIVGLNYKDSEQGAKTYLESYGNPYYRVLVDREGESIIDWGIYGTPESFLIDKQGVIQVRHAGFLNKKVWQKDFLPILKALKS